MVNTRQLLGALGEDLACQYLAGLGWRIIARNWRCPDGELDIIAAEGDSIVFIEVKTRSSAKYGQPALAVTEQKYARLRTLAWQWIKSHDVHPREIRIDIISIVIRGAEPQISHVRGEAGW